MFKVRQQQASALLNIVFSPPFFSWNGVEARFFQMVHDALQPLIMVKPEDFAIAPATNLGEVSARYSIFGGASTVSLFANRLTMNFPKLSREDTPLIQSIVGALDTGFTERFQEQQYNTMQVVSAEHATIDCAGGAADYLVRYAVPSASRLNNTVLTPGAHFGLGDKDAAWRALCTVEKSEILEDGLFLKFDVTFLKVPEGGFDDRLQRYRQVIDTCLSALELESDDA